MKSNKVFFTLILSLFLIIWLLSIATHSEIGKPTIGGKIICLVTAIIGLIIMYFSLTKNDFISFFKVYIGTWAINLILFLPSLFFPTFSIGGRIFHTVVFSTYLSSVTFLYTPLPFIFYWVFLKAFGSNLDTQK